MENDVRWPIEYRPETGGPGSDDRTASTFDVSHSAPTRELRSAISSEAWLR